MPNFEMLDEKVNASRLAADDHVIIKDQLWRVVNNHRIIGGSSRMLMLAYHAHVNPAGYKFHLVEQCDLRFDVFRKIQ